MPAAVLLVTVRRGGVVIVLGVVLAVAAAVVRMTGVVLVPAAALGVGIFAAHDLDGVGEHLDDGVEVFLDRLGIAGQVDDERLAADTGGGAGEHGIGGDAQALE